MNDWVLFSKPGQPSTGQSLLKVCLTDNNVEAVILNQKDSSFKIESDRSYG